MSDARENNGNRDKFQMRYNGVRGGEARTTRKVLASRANGRKGGRPPKR